MDNFKEGKKAGKFFAKSVKQTGKNLSKKDLIEIVKQYSGDYQKGFIEGWKSFWKPN